MGGKTKRLGIPVPLLGNAASTSCIPWVDGFCALSVFLHFHVLWSCFQRVLDRQSRWLLGAAVQASVGSIGSRNHLFFVSATLSLPLCTEYKHTRR